LNFYDSNNLTASGAVVTEQRVRRRIQISGLNSTQTTQSNLGYSYKSWAFCVIHWPTTQICAWQSTSTISCRFWVC